MPPNLILILGFGSIAWSLISGNNILFWVGVVAAIVGWLLHLDD